MIKKIVRTDCTEDVTPFPFSRNYQPTEEDLRKYLYTAWWTLEDDEEHVILMDYDGFVEYYNEHLPEWKANDGEDFWDGYSAFEFLRDHVGVTVDVVKEVQ